MSPKKRTRSASVTETEPESSRRKRNISRACKTCRKRRLRCDGSARCSTCVLYSQDCVYEPDTDGRKPATKMFVEALQTRIRTLEGMLAERGDDSDGAASPSASASPPAQMVSGSLIMDNESLAHHGPTSVFMHLPEPATCDEVGAARQAFNADLSRLNWARHLPPANTMTYEEHELLLDLFFSYFNGWSWWVDEEPFRSDWAWSVSSADSHTRTQHYSPLLHNAILSVVCLYKDDPNARIRSAAYAERAASMMEREAERGTCSTVRGLLFLGTHHWALNKRSVAWLYEGTGVRLAQTLGLNADCTHLVDRKLITPDTKRQRDRCFYTVYLQDHMTLGRAHSLTTQDFETAIPEIDPIADQVPWLTHDQRAATRSGVLVSAGPSWMSSTFYYSCHLAGLADRLQKGLYRMRSRHQEATQRRLISELHLELNAWLMSLPSPLRLESARQPLPTHVLNMHAMCRYLQILLHRPSYTRPSGVTSEARELAIKTCDFAALEIMRLLRQHDTTTGIRYTTTATTNITFTAGTIHLLAAVQPSTAPERRRQAVNDARECIRYLKAMPWFCATKGGEALEKMLVDWNVVSREPTPGADLGRFGTTRNLGDMSSDISKLLIELGWKPPATPSNDVIVPDAWPSGDLNNGVLGGTMGAVVGDPLGISLPIAEADLSSFFAMEWAPYIPSFEEESGAIDTAPENLWTNNTSWS